MSSHKDNAARNYARRLSDLEGRLRSTSDDRALLQDVQTAIRSLMIDHKESEADIRRILLDRFESGNLRAETLRLVQGMLDRIITEDLDTTARVGDTDAEPAFSDTDVIPAEALERNAGAQRLQVGSLLRDRFLLQSRVAGGSMGMVYKALDRRLAEVDGAKPWVAIKVLPPQLARNAQALRALQQEASKGRCLSHPNIVRVIDLDRDDDLYFIVMEWIEGRSLAAILDDPRSRDLDLKASLQILRQVGAALDYAHRCGVVHADVKPGNIMVTPEGDVKLIDFGVARVQQKQRESGRAADAEFLRAATPAYSSMQVLTGEDPVPADDVFSLACLFYRLVAGYRVFGPRNAAEAAEAGMHPERLDALNEDQWRVLKKALSYSRVTRYGSPRAFLDDLNAASGGRPISAGESHDDTIASEKGPSRRARWPTLTAALLLAALAAGVVVRPDLIDPYFQRLRALTGREAATPAPAASLPPEVAADRAGPPEAVATRPEPTAAVPSPEAPVAADEQEAEGPAGAGDGGGPAPSVDLVQNGSPGEREPGGAFETVEPATVGQPDRLPAAAPATPAPAGDFPTLPPATHTLRLGGAGTAPPEIAVVLREEGEAALIDVYRPGDAGRTLILHVEEVSYSGNGSPLESGEYEIGGRGIVEFAAGQERARTTLAMRSDPLREADRSIELALVDAVRPSAARARIRLTLEDDDQRAFEARLLPNTVAFAVSQVSARESETAVQIDVLRFKPDDRPLDVEFTVGDVTASEGEDYFAPGIRTISFAPGQRTARLLIPLVQDSAVERDEAFYLEIAAESTYADNDIHRRITVMIRDDDP